MRFNRILKVTVGHYFGFWIGLSLLLFGLDYYHRLSFLRSVLNRLTSPIMDAVDKPIRLVQKGQTFIQEKNDTHKIIQQLQENQLRLQVQISHSEFLRKENERLKQLLHNTTYLKERYITLAYLSHIKQASPLKSEYYINRGAKQGIKIGQVVLDAQGIIGRIIEVKANTSLVLKIDDPRNSVPVEIVRNGVRGILKGKGPAQSCYIDYLSKTSDVQIDDQLIASGIGGQYPRGYPIAHITAVEDSASCHFLKVNAAPTAALTNNSLFLVVEIKA